MRETAKEISKLNRLQCFSLCKVVLLSGIEFISYFRLRYMIFFIVNPSYFVFKKKQFRQEIRHLVIDFENVPSGYFDPSENENRGRLLDTISSAFTSVAPS